MRPVPHATARRSTTRARPARPGRRALVLGCLVAALATALFAGAGLTIRAADVGAAAVDEPQYLLTAISLWEDGDLDISDERASARHTVFHEGRLPVQTAVLDRGRRVSPHDPLLPVLIAPAMAAGGFLAVKGLLVGLGAVLAGGLVWVAVTRLGVGVALATGVAAVAGTTTPLVVYAHQVYPELPAALAVLAAVALILPTRRPWRAAGPSAAADPDRGPAPWSPLRGALLVLAISALPWLSVKYTLVAAALGAVALWRTRRPRRGYAVALAAGFAASGAVWLAAHRVLYGGWTAYATGDHFQGSGEFGVVGFAPNYLGRSSRLVGLLVDQDYGLIAWSPAWLLAPLALGVLLVARVPDRWVLLVPLAAGWFTAVFVALTMHGFWWPGRQLVVVAPLAALAVALGIQALAGPARRAVVVAGGLLGAAGMAIQAWVVLAGHGGRLTWVGAPDLDPPGPMAAWRAVLPNYREAAFDWPRHLIWVAVVCGLVALGARLARHRGAPSGDARGRSRSGAKRPGADTPGSRRPGGANECIPDQPQPREARVRLAAPAGRIPPDQAPPTGERTPMRHTTIRRTGAASVLALGLVGGLAACTGGDDNTIQVYSARHYDLEQAFELFHEETGINVQFLFGEDAELRERIAAEGEDTVADAYITVDAGNLAAGAAEGLFAPVESQTLDDAIPENLRDAENRWFGLAKRVRTIVYSPDRVQASELSTYADLADPKWAGRLCLRTANASYTQSLVASMIAARGEAETEEIVSGWVSNGRIFSNDVEIIENIASGSCDVAIVNHYYLARELTDDPELPVSIFWADQDAGGVHVNISGGGVVAAGNNPEGATRLLEWLATDGQQALVGGNLEYPANPDVEPEPILAEWGTFTEQTIDANAYAERNADAVALMGRVGYE